MPDANGPRSALLVCLSAALSVGRVPLALHRRGWVVDAFTPRWTHLWDSSLLRERIEAPDDRRAVADAVLKLIASGRWERVYLADETALLMAIEDGRPELAALIPADSKRLPHQRLCDKGFLATWAPENGIPVPAGVEATSAEAAVEWWAQRPGLPIILKPVDGMAGKGIFRPRTPDELRSSWRAGTTYVIQEYIQGRRLIGDWVAHGGRLRAVALCENYRSYGAYGIALERRYEAAERFVPLAGRIAESLGYTGFGSADIIEAPDGRLLVIEFHMRSTTGLFYRELSGVDLIHAWDEPGDKVLVGRAGGRVVQFPESVSCALEHGRIGTALGEFLQPSLWRFMCWGDAGQLRRQWWEVRRAFAVSRRRGNRQPS